MSRPDPQAVIQIIGDCARINILPRFRQLADRHISEKSPGDLVTIADLESERYLEAALTGLVAGSRCVGEEAAEGNPDILKRLREEAPVWVVDPLDGTRNFAHGREPFAIIVAYCRGGETLMGWIHNPLSGRTVWAARGQGAWSGGGEKLQTASVDDPSAMKGSLSAAAAKNMRKHKDAPENITRVGCVGQDYMDLSCGSLHFARYAVTLKPWDHAAGVLIHQEAGGYGRLVGSNRPYLPDMDPEAARNGKQVLLLAPDAESWRRIGKMTGDLQV